ncbi:hypothetical protein IW136_001671 [Coemansia sp. RSA 678]|nr:hypothetical protein IW136_001671 [Coemansia sp. RSA 678]
MSKRPKMLGYWFAGSASNPPTAAPATAPMFHMSGNSAIMRGLFVSSAISATTDFTTAEFPAKKPFNERVIMAHLYDLDKPNSTNVARSPVNPIRSVGRRPMRSESGPQYMVVIAWQIEYDVSNSPA